MLTVMVLGAMVSLADGHSAATAAPDDAQGDRVHAHARSVYEISPIRDGTLIVASLGAAGLAYAIDPLITNKRCPCQLSELNSLDRTVVGNHNGAAGWAGNISLGVFLLGLPLLDLLDVGWSREWTEDFVVYAQALAINAAAVSITKVSVHRPFPETYEGNVALINSADGYRSFYSGHSAQIAAAVTTMALTYTWRHGGAVWPWVVGALATAGIASALIVSGQHFYTDEAAGVVVGATAAYVVAWLHRRPDANAQFAVVPTTSGAAAVYVRRF